MQSAVCVCAKLLHLCLTVCEAMDPSLPSSSVHEILGARTLEWVAMPSSQEYFRPSNGTQVFLCILYWQAGSLLLVLPRKPYMPSTPCEMQG